MPIAAEQPAATNRPSWISDDAIRQTRDVWQPYYGRPLTDEEAIDILVTLGRLFQFLGEDNDGQTPAATETDGAKAIRGAGAGEQP